MMHDLFVTAMKEELALARSEGRYDPKALRMVLRENPIDVANFCLLLWANASKTDMQWLENNALAVDMVADPDNLVQVWFGTDPAYVAKGKTLAETISRAREIQANNSLA